MACSTPSQVRVHGLTDGLSSEHALDESQRAFLNEIGATVVTLTAETDLDGAYLPHLREHGHVAAIIRPDFYLYGAAASARALRGLVDQLRSQLRGNDR